MKFNALYSIYSFPNIAFPILGGIMMDKFGVRIVLLVSAFLVTIGQAIFAIGVGINSFYIALLGRGIYGCGGDNLDIAQSMIVIKWFSGKELSMAFGLNSSMSYLGTVLNDNSEPKIVESTGSVVFGLCLGFIVCLVSFLSVFLLIDIDKKRDMLNGTIINAPSDDEKFKWSNFKLFGSLYWIMLLNWVGNGSSILCFTYIASGYFQDRFGYDSVTAGSILSITSIISVIFCPIIGIIVDKIGKRGLFLIASSVLVIIFHVLLLFTPDSDRPFLPILYFTLLGTSYSIHLAVFWAAFTYIINPKIIGTALGGVYASGNIALVIFPIVTGFIQENTQRDHGYYWVNVFLLVLAIIGLIAALCIYVYDLQHNSILNMPCNGDIIPSNLEENSTLSSSLYCSIN